MTRINSSVPARPRTGSPEEANAHRNVRPRITPAIDPGLQGLAPSPDSPSTSSPPSQPSASLLPGRASPPLMGTRATSSAPAAGPEVSPHSPASSAGLFQRRLPTAPASREASTAASQDTSEFLRGFDLDLYSLPSLGSPLHAGPAGPPGNEEVQSVHRPAAASTSAAGAAPAPPAMPPAAAVQWYRNRMEDLLLTDEVYPAYSEALGQSAIATKTSRAALFNFAVSLSQDAPHDSLGNFLLRYGSVDREVSEPARSQLNAFSGNQIGHNTGRLREALDTLCTIPTEERDAMCDQEGMTEADVSVNHRRWLLPPQEQALLDPFHRFQSAPLSRFSAALLRAGHGGITEWLAMFRDGRDQLGRWLLVEHMKTQRDAGSLASALDQLQEQAGIPSARRIRVAGRRSTFVGEHRPGPAAQMPRPAAATQPAHVEMPPPNTPEDNLELVEVYAAKAQESALAPGTIVNRRQALARFAREMLAEHPQADLRGFLVRYENSDEEVRSRARADMASVILHWPEDKQRHNLHAARNLLITVPPTIGTCLQTAGARRSAQAS